MENLGLKHQELDSQQGFLSTWIWPVKLQIVKPNMMIVMGCNQQNLCIFVFLDQETSLSFFGRTLTTEAATWGFEAANMGIGDLTVNSS